MFCEVRSVTSKTDRKEIIDDEIQGKMLIIDGLGQGQIRIESFLRNVYVGTAHG